MNNFKRPRGVKLTAEMFGKIIDETTKAMANEQFPVAAEGLKELASLYKSAGANVQTFCELTDYIERCAINMSGNPDIVNKMRAHLRKVQPIIIMAKKQ